MRENIDGPRLNFMKNVFFCVRYTSGFANSFPAFAEIEITGYVSAQKYYYYLKYTQILAIFFELKKRRRSRR